MRRQALFALSSCFLFAEAAHAGCVTHPSQGAPQSVDFGTVTVPADLPAGSVIVERSSAAWTSPPFHCIKPTRTVNLGTFATANALGEGIQDTNVPGIGIRIYFKYKGQVYRAPHRFDTTWSYLEKFENAHFSVQLIKTGPVSQGGALTSGTLARAGYEDHNQVWVDLSGTQVEPERPTCAFTTRGLAFALGRVDARELLAAGSSAWVSQTLQSAGCTATARQVRMTFSAPAHPADPTLFAVTGTGAATGVGVELRSTWVDVQAIPNASEPMVLAAMSAGGGWGFRARYRAVGKTITPGPANTSIVVNVSYR